MSLRETIAIFSRSTWHCMLNYHASSAVIKMFKHVEFNSSKLTADTIGIQAQHSAYSSRIAEVLQPLALLQQHEAMVLKAMMARKMQLQATTSTLLIW